MKITRRCNEQQWGWHFWQWWNLRRIESRIQYPSSPTTRLLGRELHWWWLECLQRCAHQAWVQVEGRRLKIKFVKFSHLNYNVIRDVFQNWMLTMGAHQEGGCKSDEQHDWTTKKLCLPVLNFLWYLYVSNQRW